MLITHIFSRCWVIYLSQIKVVHLWSPLFTLGPSLWRWLMAPSNDEKFTKHLLGENGTKIRPRSHFMTKLELESTDLLSLFKLSLGPFWRWEGWRFCFSCLFKCAKISKDSKDMEVGWFGVFFGGRNWQLGMVKQPPFALRIDVDDTGHA